MGEREAGGTCALIGSFFLGGVTTACSCFFASEEKLRGMYIITCIIVATDDWSQ